MLRGRELSFGRPQAQAPIGRAPTSEETARSSESSSSGSAGPCQSSRNFESSTSCSAPTAATSAPAPADFRSARRSGERLLLLPLPGADGAWALAAGLGQQKELERLMLDLQGNSLGRGPQLRSAFAF